MRVYKDVSIKNPTCNRNFSGFSGKVVFPLIRKAQDIAIVQFDFVSHLFGFIYHDLNALRTNFHEERKIIFYNHVYIWFAKKWMKAKRRPIIKFQLNLKLDKGSYSFTCTNS